MPWNAAFLLPFFALMVTIFRIVSLSSILAALALPLATAVLYPGRTPLMVASVVATVFVIWRHRSNISRLVKGEEPRIGRGGAALRARLERPGEAAGGPPEAGADAEDVE
jgi:glycerol-3-phosphate acyltransferase PlsY